MKLGRLRFASETGEISHCTIFPLTATLMVGEETFGPAGKPPRGSKVDFSGLILAFHILLFAVALSLTEGVSVFVQVIARRRPDTVPHIAEIASLFDRVGAICWLLCAGTGTIMVYRSGIGWTASWIVGSLTAFLVLSFNGILGHSRWLHTLASLGVHSTPNPTARVKAAANIVSLVTIPTIVLLMVLKPA